MAAVREGAAGPGLTHTVGSWTFQSGTWPPSASSISLSVLDKFLEMSLLLPLPPPPPSPLSQELKGIQLLMSIRILLSLPPESAVKAS